MRLKGKIAVITGAGSGFGQATSVLFAKEGARVVGVDVNAKGNEETLRMVREAGGEGEALTADISTAEGAALAIRKAVERFGGLNVLVNNAGISDSRSGDSWNVSEETWDRIQRVNLKSVYLCSRA